MTQFFRVMQEGFLGGELTVEPLEFHEAIALIAKQAADEDMNEKAYVATNAVEFQGLRIRQAGAGFRVEMDLLYCTADMNHLVTRSYRVMDLYYWMTHFVDSKVGANA